MPIRLMTASIIAILAGGSEEALAADKVRFGTDWLAQADHGGFYQALADGTYTKHGLDVEIIPGGPNAANQALLTSGKIDFYLGTPQNVINATVDGSPLVDIAAIYQKAPQILMAHPGVETFQDLTRLADIFMSAGGYESYFAWMLASFQGFSEEQYRPYNGSLTPFVTNTHSAQQGLLTSEPYSVQLQAGWSPKVFLLADQGYKPYAQTITVRPSFIADRPDVIQRFIDATIEGWNTYLYGDNHSANELIKLENPDMTDELLAYALDVMRQYGLVDNDETVKTGIGCITEERYRSFFDTLVAAETISANFDYRRVFDAQFVCKGVGVAFRK
ncbi:MULTISPECIES: ABC transporter substrate-binding protein [Rhizobium/Agrobacterium group]|jgi:NitT/TauT family transport system substrate-binding protein|uniref:ABC transporter substrate-binding protein n=1 Tax=Rhizobium/Agrobacterium group TaxID=227290 RepID=UPI000DDF6F8F|nr:MULTISPECIES: ABC transporter substrate-binding protein [Rhizobium/Agrobacterium group]MBP2461831.1 NitT/TauT family transport system substrate-binding protein [Rhizobium sp. PvP014]MBP2529226.1 NitT/TauT family transport system substrate-binding protein [Rhizobium sp. PvP099]NSY17509.1 ABC transporter substrate-binding protein [Neorhizobium sp. AL 9.2.2]